jgi:DNA topoisomerase-1
MRGSIPIPGIRRVRRGRGSSYAHESGRRVSNPDELLRISELAIPPAWREVWICADPSGHLQATGIDAAGRGGAQAVPVPRALARFAGSKEV